MTPLGPTAIPPDCRLYEPPGKMPFLVRLAERPVYNDVTPTEPLTVTIAVADWRPLAGWPGYELDLAGMHLRRRGGPGGYQYHEVPAVRDPFGGRRWPLFRRGEGLWHATDAEVRALAIDAPPARVPIAAAGDWVHIPGMRPSYEFNPITGECRNWVGPGGKRLREPKLLARQTIAGQPHYALTKAAGNKTVRSLASLRRLVAAAEVA